jgi:uncharacterized membrane protein YgcG
LIAETVQRMQQLLPQQPAGGADSVVAESQRLADVRQLKPTATARAAIPPYLLAKLPADVEQLREGHAQVPLLPSNNLEVSQTLQSMMLNGQGAGSLRYEAQATLTYEGILDLMRSWLVGYSSLLDSVLQGDANSRALLQAPLGGLRYLEGWLTGAVRGRLSIIESHQHEGGDGMKLLASKVFDEGDTYTFTNEATREHQRLMREAKAKLLAKKAAESALSSGRGRGGSRGGSSGGRGRGRGGNGRDEGSSSSAGAGRS